MSTPTNTQFAVAVHALTYLAASRAAGRTSPIGSEELADSTAVNAVHVRRVLGPLRAAGLVRSRAGAGGGWEIDVDPAAITLAHVWRTLQGEDPVLGIHGPNPDCPVGGHIQGMLVDLDRRITQVLTAELDAISLEDVLSDAGFDAETYAVLAAIA